MIQSKTSWNWLKIDRNRSKIDWKLTKNVAFGRKNIADKSHNWHSSITVTNSVTFCAVKCQNSRKFRFHCVNEIFDFFFRKMSRIKKFLIQFWIFNLMWNHVRFHFEKKWKIGQFWFLKEHKSVKVGLIHWFNHRATS